MKNIFSIHLYKIFFTKLILFKKSFLICKNLPIVYIFSLMYNQVKIIFINPYGFYK